MKNENINKIKVYHFRNGNTFTNIEQLHIIINLVSILLLFFILKLVRTYENNRNQDITLKFFKYTQKMMMKHNDQQIVYTSHENYYDNFIIHLIKHKNTPSTNKCMFKQTCVI